MSTKPGKNAIHELQAACDLDHIIRWRWHDEDERQPALGCVVEVATGRKDGLCRAWDPEGRLMVEGQFAEDKPTGIWARYRPSGRLDTEEQHDGEGGIHRRRYAADGVRIAEEGPCVLSGGQWIPHGRWTAYPQGGPPEEVIYDQGRVTRRVGAHPVLAAWYRPEPNPHLKAQRMAEVSEGRLFDALADLGAKDLLHPDAPLAVALAMTAWYDQITRAHEVLLPVRAEALPLMVAEAEALLADGERLRGSQGGRLAAVCALCLWRLADEAPGEAFDPLIQRAMAQFDRLSEGMGKVVRALEDLLKALPKPRREALILGAHLGQPPLDGPPRLLWPYAGCCPTPGVIRAALDETLRWPRDALAGGLARAVSRSWARLAKRAVDTLTEALGRGGEAVGSPHRALLVQALAEAVIPEAGHALAGRLTDPSERVRQIARRGLIALGDDAIDPLIPLLHSRQSAKRLAGARTLGALPWTPAVAEMAERRRTKEDHEDVRALLDEIADPQRQPVGLMALRAARANVDLTRWARWLEGLISLPPDQRAAKIEALLAGKAPAHAAEALPWILDRVVDQASGITITVKGVTLPWPPTVGVPAFCARLGELKGPEAPWMAAELAVRLPGRRWPIHQTLDDLVPRVGGPQLAEALTWWLTRDPPAERKRLLGWLAERYPAEGAAALLEGAQDKAVGVREVARRGLIHWGGAGLPQIRGLLRASADGREVAAEVLRAVPDPDSIEPLVAAVARESHPRRLEVMESALMACRLIRGRPEDVAPEQLDAALARRAPEAEAVIPDPGPGVTLRWRAGAALSEGASRWWLHTLTLQDHPLEISRELSALTPHLEASALSALARALLDRYPKDAKHRWVLALHAMLGEDADQGALGADLDDLLHRESADLAGRAVEALQARPTPQAVLWLDHWARQGRGSLRQRCRGALIALAGEGGALEGLAELALIEAGAVPDDQRGQAVARLEEAMITDHRWAPERAWALFGPEGSLSALCEGLIFAAHPAQGSPIWFMWAAGAPVDEGGHPLLPAMIQGAEAITLPHPILFPASSRPRWRRALAEREITPPCPQLDRMRGLPGRITLERARQTVTSIAQGVTLRTRQMLNTLDEQGYLRGKPRAGGWIHEAWRAVGHHWHITLAHDGFHPLDGRSVHGRQSRLEACWIHLAGAPPEAQDPALIPPGMWCEAWGDLRALMRDEGARRDPGTAVAEG